MKLLILTIFIFSTTLSGAQNLIQNGNFESDKANWDYWHNQPKGFEGTFNIITDDVAEGTKAAKISIENTGSTYWTFKHNNIRIRQNGFSVNDADVLRITFKAKATGNTYQLIRAGIAPERAETDNCDGSLEDCFWETNMNDYDLVNFQVTEEWQTYTATLLSTQSTDDVQLVFRVGEKTGDYYIDDITLEVEKNIADQNDWYADAQQRIDTLRKGNFSLKVLDNDDNPVKNSTVKIEHVRHNFQWGTAVRPAKPSTFNHDEKQWEREKIKETFNTIVNENNFKWPKMEPSQGNVVYENVDLYFNWAMDHNFDIRGHTLFWPKVPTWHPEWARNLDDEAEIDAMRTRIERDMQHYRGVIDEYDVVNEPFHNPYLAETFTDSIYAWIYKTARQADPNARLYVNEWGNLDLWEHVRYRNFIENMLADGAPLDGIGLQSHLNKPVNWRSIKFKLDYLSEIGIPIKITEFDQNVGVNGLTESEQAADYGEMMRIAFSHPNIDGFLIWGLITGYSNSVESIYNPDLSKRQAADTMKHLIKEVWTTKTTADTDENGMVNFSGYYGDYNIIIDQEGKTDTFRVNFSRDQLMNNINLAGLPQIHFRSPNDNSEFAAGTTINLDIEASDQNGYVETVQVYLNDEVIHEFPARPFIYDWQPDTTGVFSLSARAIDNEGNSNFSDTLEITIGDPPYITGLDATGKQGEIRVYPNFASHYFNVESNDDAIPATFFLYNQYGKLILEQNIVREKARIDLPEVSDGVYFGVYKSQRQIYSTKLMIRQ